MLRNQESGPYLNWYIVRISILFLNLVIRFDTIASQCVRYCAVLLLFEIRRIQLMSNNVTPFRNLYAYALTALVFFAMSCSSEKTKDKKTAPTITSTAPTTAAVGLADRKSVV